MRQKEFLQAAWMLFCSFLLLPGIAGGIERGSISLKSGVIWSAVILASLLAISSKQEVRRG